MAVMASGSSPGSMLAKVRDMRVLPTSAIT